MHAKHTFMIVMEIGREDKSLLGLPTSVPKTIMAISETVSLCLGLPDFYQS